MPWGSQEPLPYTPNKRRGKWQHGRPVMGTTAQRKTQTDSPPQKGMTGGEGSAVTPAPTSNQPLKPEGGTVLPPGGPCKPVRQGPSHPSSTGWWARGSPGLGGAHCSRTSAEGTQVSPGLG